MSGGVPIPRVGGLVEEGSRVALVSSSPDWSNAATPGSLHNSDMKGSWQGHNMNLRGVHNTMHRRVESLDTEDYSSRFFQPLMVADQTDRMIAIENITELLLLPENERLLRAHIRTLVRLSTEAPYEDVMQGCQRILVRVEREFEYINIPKASAGPSRFISNSTIPPITTTDPVVSRIFQDLFLQVGRVTHTNRILALHPQHLKRYYLTFSKIMREPGPLPLHWRNYIAILSSARFNCSYLSTHQESEFLLNNGDPDWLQGVEHSPKKIQNLISVIAVMAHQPWVLTKEHIEKLVKGHDAWSISELVHAMLLVSTYVSLAGFIFGCGVTPEVDLEEDEIEKESELGIVHSNPYEGGLATGTAVTGEEGQEKKSGEHVNNSNNGNSGNREGKRDSASVDTFKLMELLKRGIAEEESKDKAKDFANAGTDGDHANKQLSRSSSGIQQDVSRYKGNIEMSHTDFDVKAKSYSIFLAQEYGWREHGYELLRRFYPDIADLLDEEFTQTYLMTYNTFSTSTHIDTLPFRRAIWYYVQRVKGMCHDDYNYQEVNMLLNRDVKFFVKKLACFPDSITQHDFNDLKLELRPEEKCHVALLAMESHKQACLLYGLHAVMQYMNKY